MDENKKLTSDINSEMEENADEEITPQQTMANNSEIIQFGQSQTKNERGNIYCITIIGQIEGHMILPSQNKTTKYEHILPQLAAIEENPQVDALLLLLNTVGGDVEAGLAISELIAGMNKPTVSLVLGGGHSIGVPLAVSCDYSFIVPTATMTVHPLRMNGLVIGVSQTFSYFDKMQDRIGRFVEKNAKISAADFKELMLRTGQMANDVGTILFGEEAVECGLIDECGGIARAFEQLYKMIGKEKAE